MLITGREYFEKKGANDTIMSTMRKKLTALMFAMLKLGFTAFGGPVAAIAMMHQEFVLKRHWLSEEEFLDFWGISTLIPGPNAMEFAIHIGYHHASWPGMIVAGVCYLLPAVIVVLILGRIYTQFGTIPMTESFLYGVKPVVIAILVSALIGMIRPHLQKKTKMIITIAVFIAYILGVDPVILMVASGLLHLLVKVVSNHAQDFLPLAGFLSGSFAIIRQEIPAIPFTLGRLFLVFLKAGAFMYGSGYVLLAFIQEDLVNRLGWLTQSELIDAIAVGQVTPGPLSTTATFVGYILGGTPAALLATFAMFLPGFIFVVFSLPLLRLLKKSVYGKKFLEGINFAALGLMMGVIWEISLQALADPIAILIAIIMLIVLLRFKTPTHWLILCGGIIGLIKILFG